MSQSMPVEIFTDGACKKNPGPGGWGVLLRFNGQEKSLFGGELETTNNRMEMMAVIQALSHLKRPCKIILTTDSRYVMDGITSWIAGWKKRNWLNKKREPVKNADLWKVLDEEASRHQIEWKWVKGHSGHRENEIADDLANQGVAKVLAKNTIDLLRS